MELPSYTKLFHHKSYPSISPARLELSAKDKIVLITGGGSGIGAATALAFAEANAYAVVLTGRRYLALESTKSKIASAFPHCKVLTRAMDISAQESVVAVFGDIVSDLGRIDICVNAAGHLADDCDLTSSTLSNFWTSFEINVKGAFLLAQSFLNQESRFSSSKIFVSVNSCIAHFPASAVTTAPAVYSISKLAQAKLTEFIAHENKDAGVRAYAIQPGLVRTEMSNKSMTMSPEGTGEMLEWDDIDLPAHFMLWLSSPEAASIPSGKYLWSNWDVDELEGRSEALRKDSMALTMTMSGWPFGTTRYCDPSQPYE